MVTVFVLKHTCEDDGLCPAGGPSAGAHTPTDLQSEKLSQDDAGDKLPVPSAAAYGGQAGIHRTLLCSWLTKATI